MLNFSKRTVASPLHQLIIWLWIKALNTDAISNRNLQYSDQTQNN